MSVLEEFQVKVKVRYCCIKLILCHQPSWHQRILVKIAIKFGASNQSNRSESQSLFASFLITKCFCHDKSGHGNCPSISLLALQPAHPNIFLTSRANCVISLAFTGSCYTRMTVMQALSHTKRHGCPATAMNLRFCDFGK